MVENLSPEEYHGMRDYASSSGLKIILDKSPLHFHHDWTTHCEDDDATDGGIKIKTLDSKEKALRYGSLCHMALLESNRFRESYILEPVFEGMTKGKDAKMSTKSEEAKLKKLAWYQALPKDKFVVTQEDFEAIQGTVYSILGRPDARGLLEGSKTEVSLFYKHPATGIKIRIRPDILKLDPKNGIFLTDLKTARDASEYGFSRQVGQLLYNVSLALYYDGIKEVLGEYPRVATWLPVEKKAPWACNVLTMEEQELHDGRVRYEAAVEILYECLSRDVWPSYQAGAQPLQLPSYFLNRPLPMYDFEQWSKK